MKRMQWNRLICLIALLVTALVMAAQAEEQSELDQKMDKALRNHKTSGAAIVVAKDGEIVYEHYYGWAVKKQKEAVTGKTYFKLASVTKMGTAIRVMQLVEQGKLNLDQNISELLGYTVRNPYYKKTPITLRMLMTHTASLDPHGGYSKESNPLSSLISAEKGKRSSWYDEKPGSVYRYSNFGAGIIGSLMECATGINIDQNRKENVFDPMGITAAYAARLLPDPENVPCLYNASGKLSGTREKHLNQPWEEEVDPDRHYRITVGSLWMRPRDLCRIGMMLCDGGICGETRLLQEETVQEMMSDQCGKGDVTAKTPYGLCIYHEKTLVDGKTLYGHQGMSDGVLCSLYYDPETRFVFALSSNGCNNQQENRVAHLTRRAFSLAWEAFGEK